MWRKMANFKKLNTNGYCFICLKPDGKSRINDPVTITSLQSYLQIKLSTIKPNYPDEQEVEVNLCNLCENDLVKFSDLFHQLEKIKLEMNCYLRKFQCRIDNTKEDPELVGSYSELVFVDKLRKEIAAKCSNMMTASPKSAPLSRFEETNPVNNETSTEVIVPKEEISDKDSDSEFDQEDSGSDFDATSESARKKDRISDKYSADPLTGRYPCPEPSCDKTFANPGNVHSHYQGLHLQKTYKCNICNSSLLYNRSFKAHEKACREKVEKNLEKEKDPRFKFICEVCDKRFDKKQNLEQHRKRTHQGPDAKRFPCDICEKTFSLKWNLIEHKERIHFFKKYYCRYCNKMFSRRQTGQKHEKVCKENKKS